MPSVMLAGSPLVLGVSPVRIHYRVGRSPEGSRSMEREALAERPAIVFLIEAIGGAVRTVILPAGGHSPHSEPATAGDVSRIALDFIDGIRA